VVSASTEPFKAREKFDYWHQVCQSEIFRIECEALPGTHFDAFARGVALESTSVINIGIAPHRAIRRPDEMIDAKARGVFALFVRSGELLFEQDGRSLTVGAGDATFGCIDRRFVLGCQQWSCFSVVKLSTDLWTRPSTEEEAFTARSLAHVNELGSMISRFVMDFSGKVETLDGFAINRLSRVCADLLGTCFDMMSGSTNASRYSQRTATLSRVKLFIKANLADPNLCARTVASRLKLSTRYLNRLFESEGTSLMRYVWSQRLEGAASELANPRLRKASISTISFGLGFKNLSHFSYTFRERFGIPPSEYRRSFEKVIQGKSNFPSVLA